LVLHFIVFELAIPRLQNQLVRRIVPLSQRNARPSMAIWQRRSVLALVPVAESACAAMAEIVGCAVSPGALDAMTRKIADIGSAVNVIVTALIASQVAHFDKTGFRIVGKLASAHSAPSGKYALVTVHSKRGTNGMDAAGVLPSFTGIGSAYPMWPHCSAPRPKGQRCGRPGGMPHAGRKAHQVIRG
jgi:hypothetical protein